MVPQKAPGGGGTDLDDPLLVMPEGAHDHDLTTFFPLFSSYIYRLVDDLASLTYSTRRVVRDFAADGVVYLELRTTPRAVPAAGLDKAGYVRAVLDAIAQEERELAGEEEEKKKKKGSIRVRLILSVDRRNTLQEAWEVLRLARQFAASAVRGGGDVDAVPSAGTSGAELIGSRWGVGGVVGIDLCGDTSCGDVSLFTPVMLAARDGSSPPSSSSSSSTASEPGPGLGLQLTIHFAEAPGTGTDEELRTILDWRPSRLGHVIHVSDAIKRRIVEQSGTTTTTTTTTTTAAAAGPSSPIGLELCLSSNVQLKMTTGGFDAHHFGEWWSKVEDGPVIIMPCTDDVGVFESPSPTSGASSSGILASRATTSSPWRGGAST
ncbi:adenosine deaminase [Microdochium nivale]|nr:adenosine deaminase [Microdochium nivale]